ncbi:EAL domain-containing protein [Psychromonas sp.]|uniref:EAL domain-containing protein n=1 Tax=Psychromonas sp. TaxID=1884585 RepID=UPI00356494C3
MKTKKLRFSRVILSLVLGLLIISSAILLIPVHRGAEQVLEHQVELAYQRDQHALDALMDAQFNNIKQISQGLTDSEQLQQGLTTENVKNINSLLGSLLASGSGKYIDALIVESKDGSSIISSNVSVLGVQLPLEQISKGYSPFGIWTSITWQEQEKLYSLLRLSLPLLAPQSGEVIGKLHTFVLLNNNFWIINQLHELFGSQAISLSSDNILLDALESQPGQLQTLHNAPFSTDKSPIMMEKSTLRTHYLQIGNSDQYKVHSLLSNDKQLLIKNAYFINIYFAAGLVVLLAIATIVLLHYLISNALQQITRYAEQVPQSGSPTTFNGGRFAEFIRVGNAVEKMLQRIRDRDKHLSCIVDNSTNLIFIKDLKNNFQLINQPLAEVIDANKERGLSEKIMPLMFAEDKQVQISHHPVQYEMKIENNNAHRSFLVNKFPIMDDHGELASIGAIATDITNIKEAEDQLRLAQQVFAETAESIIVLDDKLNVVSVNKAFSEMIGYGAGDASLAIYSFMVEQPEIMQKLQHAMRWQGEATLRGLDGRTLPVLVSATRLSSEDAQKRYVLLFNDITELKFAEQRLERLASYDSLTGLPNRSFFKQKLDEAMRSDSLLITALMSIDLDHFKNINDTYGHAVGDQMLQQVADRLRTCIQAKDTVARLGGDEFTVILREIRNLNQVRQIAERILSTLSKPYQLNTLQCFSTVSIGVSLIGKDGEDADTLTRHADQAMYQAKARGRDVIQFFDVAINSEQQRRHYLEEELHKTLDNNELFMQYQPRFDIEGKQMLSAEALLRWRHPEHGLISPGEFIPVAEGSSLIIEIGRFVLQQACSDAARWNAEGYPIPVSVNLSPRQLSSPSLIQDITTALENSALSPHLLELEITETHVMENINQILPVLQEIRAMGIKFAVDDFGTGYCSLMYLKKLPIDTLKIDRSFILDVPGDGDDENLVRAIISMSRNLNLRVVAEGVETKEQQQFLREQGCDELQGYLLGRPDSVEQLKKLAAAQASENSDADRAVG